MNRARKFILAVLLIALAAGALSWWLDAGSTVAGVKLTNQQIRVWGYANQPTNPVLSWWATKVRVSDNRKRNGHGGNALDFNGTSMCWGYSSPTSAWFHFGNNLWGQSNFPYFELALPTTNDVAAAIAELPNLTFHGNDSNYWATRVGTKNLGFQSNTVGQGAIRIPFGSVLFVRHVDHPEAVHLLSVKSMDKGLWGNVNAQFQRGLITQDTSRVAVKRAGTIP
jgi:hypothetical protein